MTKIAGWCALVCRQPDVTSVARLVDAFAAHGVEARAIGPLPAWSDGDAPALALCRLPSGTSDEQRSPWLDLELAGLRFVNRPSVLHRVHDKGYALSELLAAGVPVPPTLRISRDDPADLSELPGTLFVVKPITGSAGRGVTTGLQRDLARACAETFADVSGPVLVQPYLGSGEDTRLFVVGERIVAAMTRTPSRSGRGSLLYGGIARPADVSPAAGKLALHAARTLDLDIAGVDLVHHEGKDLVLEVNSCPGLKGISSATGVDVAAAIAGFCCSLQGSLPPNR